MKGFTSITVKRSTYQTFKKVSELTNEPIAEILTDIAENLEKALKDVNPSFNYFTFACAYDSSKRLVVLKILEMLFGVSLSSQEEVERKTKQIIREAIKKNREDGVLA